MTGKAAILMAVVGGLALVGVGALVQHSEASPVLGSRPPVVRRCVGSCAGSGAKVTGPAPTPIYPEPAWAKVVHPVLADEFVNVANTFQNADSLWRDGAIPEDNYTVWSNLYVWTGDSGGQAFIGTDVPDAVNPTDAKLYDVQYTCPRQVPNLYIVSISDKLVTFRSTTGVTGTFDLATHIWSFTTVTDTAGG